MACTYILLLALIFYVVLTFYVLLLRSEVFTNTLKFRGDEVGKVE